MKKIKLNEESCIGCGACIAVDPEHFEFNDDGHSSVKKQDNFETSALQNAVESCPTGAIDLVDKDNCQCNDECHCGNDCHCEN